MRAVVRVSGPEDARAAETLLARQGYRLLDPADDPDGDVDLLVVDEWTPEDAPWVRRARTAGTPTAVLAELLLTDAPGRVVAVTGTAGKTSTCRALAYLLHACGVPVCMSATARSSNAWPDHSLVDAMTPGAVVVAELTSTHLCHMGMVRADVGVVTTVRPDHVELHGSIDRYHAAKRRLVEAVQPGDPLILPVDDPSTLHALGMRSGSAWGFGEGDAAAMGAFLQPGGGVRLRAERGERMTQCGMGGTARRAHLAASAAALALGVPAEEIAAALPDVPGAPHRMASRAIGNGSTLIDNAMAATPLKVLAGLEDAPPGPLVLVIGGDPAPTGVRVHDSPAERDALRRALERARSRAETLVAFGPAGPEVHAAVGADAVVDDIRTALEQAVGECPRGGTVMVAPMFPMSPEDREFVAGYSPGG